MIVNSKKISLNKLEVCLDLLKDAEYNSKCSLLLCSNRDEALIFLEILQSLTSNVCVLDFAEWDCEPFSLLSPSMHVQQQRIRTLTQLLNAEKKIILVSTVYAVGQYLVPKNILLKHQKSFELGKTYSRNELIQTFNDNQLVRVECVYAPGEYAIRGSIIDIFPLTYLNPLRLDFFGEELDQIQTFDPLTQRVTSKENMTEMTLLSHSEVMLNDENMKRLRQCIRPFTHEQNQGLEEILNTILLKPSALQHHLGLEHYLPFIYEKLDSILDYVSIDDIWMSTITDQYISHFIKKTKEQDSLSCSMPRHLYWEQSTWDDFFKNTKTTLVQESTSSLWDIVDFTKKNKEERWNIFLDILNSIQNKQIIFNSKSSVNLEKMKEYLSENWDDSIQFRDDFSHLYLNDADHVSNHAIIISNFYFNRSFETNHMVYIHIDDLFDKQSHVFDKKQKNKIFWDDFIELTPDDLVIHKQHGLGQYKGLKTIDVEGIRHDCLQLIYDSGDRLFLPVENGDLISRYGEYQENIELDKLGSNLWQNRRNKAKQKIAQVADYLIKIAAQRELKKAPIFDVIQKQYEQFCARFPYVETNDQQSAIEDVFEDLRSGRPMDRLVCGDVGFGKTEIALRAAFVVAQNGKQVVVIAPTTLLCRQHYKNFCKRFEGFGCHIQQLSRLVAPKFATQIRKDVEIGKVDIIITTHAILNKTQKFSDLGLVIVDEEQHFGVKQKEKLKMLQSDVHILTLTATPIPRTLQLSLTGVRDLSLITTPPMERQPVRTIIIPFNPYIVRDGIQRELNRQGQVFFVTPRLERLPKLEEELRLMLPNARIGMAHGQLSATDLEDVMTKFYDKEFDILLSTNIVESGIDVPNANTLIVDRVDLFGLSQLYQLRGRVGRGTQTSYAYLTYESEDRLTQQAKKRLDVIRRLDSLGSGFSLASHDLDIRGAGNIMGEAQSGHIKDIGVEMYQNMLQEAILNLKQNYNIDSELDEELLEDWSPLINVGVPVLIPEDYVQDLGVRLNLYRRSAKLKHIQDAEDFVNEIANRFGQPPQEFKNLMDILIIKIYCWIANIEKIDAGNKGLTITFKNNAPKNPEQLLTFLKNSKFAQKGILKLRPDHKISFLADLSDPRLKLAWCKKIVEQLSKVN